MIAVVDYGMGNLGSVENACAFLGIAARIVRAPAGLDAADGIILPGQGAFGDCMANLGAAGFVDPLREWIDADRPLLGVCIGLQVLYEGSDESPETAGLGVLPGRLRRFEPGPGRKVPQMGWSACDVAAGAPLFRDIATPAWFYFVHSYYAPLAGGEFVSATASYGLDYTAAISRGRLHATQFHPEKSQESGKQLLRNFQRIVETPS